MQIFWCLLLLGCVSYCHGGSFFPCKPCYGESCDDMPTGCTYGITRNSCGKRVCAAGPGQLCGGRDHYLGKCGEGMTCKCSRCRGCSIIRLMNGVIQCQYADLICT